MNKLSLLVLFLLVGAVSFSQDSTATKYPSKKEKKDERRQKISDMIKQSEEGVLIYSKQSIFGFQLRTNGYGGFYELGKMKTVRRTNIYRLDITETKDAKEQKLVNLSNPFGNSLIFGKINYFYPVTLGFGQQYMFGQKGNKNGVAVSGIYNAGLVLGLLRPYYISVNDPATNTNRSIKYSAADSALFADPSVITNGGGFGKGWNEIKVKPGAYAKVAMRFDYGRFNETVTGLEIGLSAEAYASKIPILLYQKDKRLFFQGYVAILFGRRK